MFKVTPVYGNGNIPSNVKLTHGPVNKKSKIFYDSGSYLFSKGRGLSLCVGIFSKGPRGDLLRGQRAASFFSKRCGNKINASPFDP